MQLNIYVNQEHEANVRALRAMCAVEGKTVTSLVHEAIEQYLALRWTLRDLRETATAHGRTPEGLLRTVLEEYLTLHQEV